MNCVATIGFFDGVHRGHQYLIRQVRQEADKRGMKSLLVTFVDHPLQVIRPDFSPLLISTAEEKEVLLRHTDVDDVAMLTFTHDMQMMTARDFMQQILRDKLGVRVLIIGYDHRFGHNRDEGFDEYVSYGKQLGIEVILSKEYTTGDIAHKYSSSSVRKALCTGDIATANHILGRAYSLSGYVVSGYQVGRRIGFPTANIQPASTYKIIPPDGVYAVKIEREHDDTIYSGMMNIGHRPTLDNGDDRSIEVHIFDFHGNIYNENVRIHFIAHIREERKFDAIESLQHQLAEDERVCRSYDADTTRIDLSI